MTINLPSRTTVETVIAAWTLLSFAGILACVFLGDVVIWKTKQDNLTL